MGALIDKLIPSTIPVRTSVGFQQARLGFGSGFVARFFGFGRGVTCVEFDGRAKFKWVWIWSKEGQ
jgi:hypothetical protein